MKFCPKCKSARKVELCDGFLFSCASEFYSKTNTFKQTDICYSREIENLNGLLKESIKLNEESKDLIIEICETVDILHDEECSYDSNCNCEFPNKINSFGKKLNKFLDNI